MRGRDGRRVIIAAEASERNVVADNVLIAVDAIVIVALGADETAGVLVSGIDDLVGSGDNAVDRREPKRTVLVMLVVTLWLLLGGYSDSQGREGEGK